MEQEWKKDLRGLKIDPKILGLTVFYHFFQNKPRDQEQAAHVVAKWGQGVALCHLNSEKLPKIKKNVIFLKIALTDVR